MLGRRAAATIRRAPPLETLIHPITRREFLPSAGALGTTVLSLGHSAPAGAQTASGKMHSWPLNTPRSSRRDGTAIRQIFGRSGEVWLPESGTELVTVIRAAA